MTRETVKQLLESGVFQAFVDGKDIQYLLPDGTWSDVIRKDWLNLTNSDLYPLRIKPEPRHFWIGASKTEPFSSTNGFHLAYPTKELANQSAAGGSAACTEVIEVIK